MNSRYSIALIVCFLSMEWRCSSMPDIAGGGTDVSNPRIIGKIVQLSGQAAKNTQVQLIPYAYNPVTDLPLSDSLIDTTDVNGEYQFSLPGQGIYNILAVHLENRTRLLIRDIPIAQENDTIPEDTLRTHGTIKIEFSDTNLAMQNGYVFIRGTNIRTLVLNTQSVTIDSVPAEMVPAVLYTEIGNPAVLQILQDSILVSPDDTTTIIYNGWRFSRNVYLNTTASGAGITGNVYNFPVLIRLTNSTFSFSQADGNGEDIRFTKPDSTALPHEIELWDSANQTAVLWVTVDTIFGNDDTQYITMHWGNPLAANTSNSTAVFDTAHGWTGVWHLSENAPDTITDALYHNAVENGNHGDDRVTASGKEGMIGRGQQFSTGDYITVSNATLRLQPYALTVSSWVKVFAFNVFGGEVATMGDNYILKVDLNAKARLSLFSHPDSVYLAVCYDTSNTIADSVWYYLTATYDGSDVRVYVNGELRGHVAYTGGIIYNGSPDFVIGRHATNKAGHDFTGIIDEVVCASVARSPDWIKLCFMNQKEDDALTVFE